MIETVVWFLHNQKPADNSGQFCMQHFFVRLRKKKLFLFFLQTKKKFSCKYKRKSGGILKYQATGFALAVLSFMKESTKH